MKTPHAFRWGSALLLATLTTACADEAPTASDTTKSTNRGMHPRNAAALSARRALPAGLSLDHQPGHPAGVIISNGVVQLGVNPEAHLNVDGGQPSSGSSPTTYVGVRFVQTQSEATAPGCLCEGWGAGDATSGVSGWANIDGYDEDANRADNGPNNLTLESFTHTTSSAVSRVLIKNPAGANVMRVTHDYHPSPATQYLYEVVVTIENLSPNTISPRYRRVMDWDIAPNTFDEYVTIQGTAGASNVLYASNNGFETGNPLGSRSDLGHVGDFTDSGPNDHGALFDFGFEPLAPGQSKQFIIFYGAAPSQSAADFALTQVGAELYSYGQADIAHTAGPGSACVPWTPAPGNRAPSGTCGAERGEPHTFIFAFRSVGGAPVFQPLNVTLNISPRPISLSKSNLITVWLPSTATFDATKTVPGSATLGNESDPEAAITTLRGAPYAMTGDFNRDGRTDMAFVFRRADLQATGDLTTATTRLVLRASHSVEGLIRAEGSVAVVP